MMEMVVTTGTIICAKLQSKCHQQINTHFFTGQMPFLSPNQQRQNTERKCNENELCVKILMALKLHIVIKSFALTHQHD